MSSEKKRIRQAFRDSVFDRDSHACRVCGAKVADLDAHHITDRNLMPNGGYVKENGISLCHEHHEMAEVFHSTGEPLAGFSPDELYVLVGSSHVAAVKASQRLK